MKHNTQWKVMVGTVLLSCEGHSKMGEMTKKKMMEDSLNYNRKNPICYDEEFPLEILQKDWPLL